ncbi:hypothetical protein [Streptomyces sp. NPDC059787]|uniref:hypothetical protein n=1 Tax=Streptomyces sp. NPDC059787 TaxID=3346947 RepID=UPI003662AF84
MKRTVVAAAVGLLLVGCSSPSEDEPDEKPQQTSVATASGLTEEPADEAPPPATVDEAPAPVTVIELYCYGGDGPSEYYSTVEAAWAGKHGLCDATLGGVELSDVESKAVTTAYGEGAGLDQLAVLYGICAENGAESWDYLKTAGSEEQLSEVRGALQLCPDHPQQGTINKLIGGADKRNDLEADGRVFGSGVYRVGLEIKPGTYYTTDVEGCYWERQDANGEVVDNNFTSAAKRVQVTISSSDYAFNSEHCGEWQPVDG